MQVKQLRPIELTIHGILFLITRWCWCISRPPKHNL